MMHGQKNIKFSTFYLQSFVSLFIYLYIYIYQLLIHVIFMYICF